jgi:hypothetical protein
VLSSVPFARLPSILLVDPDPAFCAAPSARAASDIPSETGLIPTPELTPPRLVHSEVASEATGAKAEFCAAATPRAPPVDAGEPRLIPILELVMPGLDGVVARSFSACTDGVKDIENDGSSDRCLYRLVGVPIESKSRIGER